MSSLQEGFFFLHDLKNIFKTGFGIFPVQGEKKKEGEGIMAEWNQPLYLFSNFHLNMISQQGIKFQYKRKRTYSSWAASEGMRFYKGGFRFHTHTNTQPPNWDIVNLRQQTA